MDIRPFSPDEVDDLRAFVELTNASEASVAPWARTVTLREAAGRYRHGWDGEPATPYLAVLDGEVVAAGTVSTSERDNLHLAWLGVDVRPDLRRRGLGSEVLARLEADARALGRTSLGLGCWDVPGLEDFALAHGYERRSTDVNRRQLLPEVDPTVVDALHDDALLDAADYELVRRRGRTPEAELDALAVMTAAINDAPTGDLDIEDEVFDADRVRAYEHAHEQRGIDLYRVVARLRRTGELAGQTVVGVDRERPHLGDQHDTSVVAAHRGHRLGTLLKTDMLRWLRGAEPQLAEIDTWNAESNGFMIGVNEQLGYRVMGRSMDLQKSV
ncbi:GNAT family N-acetyltransferase [Nocardioides litoris]|uniref:GNAT family N-acetyltransferase n=1 Tax=Nocardioides litoris TaxID=1926648 RepID=UPI0011223BC4|nr:GNAT family N-acetyltransferase [Nocardioides litoris]